MAKPAKKPERTRTGVNVNVWINPQLGEAFREYLERTRPTPTTTSAVELALEMLVKSAGIEIKSE